MEFRNSAYLERDATADLRHLCLHASDYLGSKRIATIYAATMYPTNSIAENTLVTYSISCGTPNACGTLSASDEVGAMVYKAPAAIPSGATVTVTATSVANSSLSRSTTITIVPPIPISVTFFGAPPASLQVGASFALRALIENDVTANPQVKWTVACGSAACGSFNPTTTYSEARPLIPPRPRFPGQFCHRYGHVGH